MAKESEVRYLVEAVDGAFCVFGYNIQQGKLLLTEADGDVHSIPLDNIIKVTRETVTKEDITEYVKEVALV